MQQRIRMLSFLLLLQLASPFVHGRHPPHLQTALANSNKRNLLRRDSSLAHPSSSITEKDIRPSVISKLFFQYVDPMIQKAKTERLMASDALPIETTRNAQSTNRNVGLSKVYHLVKHRHKTDSPRWQLSRALLLENRRIILTSGLLRLTNTLVQAFPAMIISRLLKLMEVGTQEPAKKSVLLVLQLVAVLSVKMVLENQYFHRAIQTSLSVRTSLSDLIFAQALTLPSGGSQVLSNTFGSGQNATMLGAGGVLNLLQSDCGSIESAFLQIHTAWDAPLQIAIYTALLYKFMGPAVLYGIGVLIAVIPINMIILRFLQKISKAEMAAREARTRLTAESIRNMKILKLLAWDTTDRIEEHRNKELRRRGSRGALGALNSAISNAVPAFVLVVTMAAYKGPISASAIFTAISLFNQLRFPLFFLPMWLDAMANGKIAMDRVSSFLSTPRNAEYISRDVDTARISIRNGNFFWPATTVPALKDVNLNINNGEVVAVVGSVGTGKTAFIKSLIGELQPVPANVISSTSHSADRPTVKIGNTAYCSQEAWLPKGSLRDAIVFGRLFDATRYKESLYTAGLDQDFNAGTLDDGTDVGEGGSSLSGGQRARVALARALYSSDAKIFLLDDCLAALDAKVGGLVFSRLQAFAKKIGATVVLATNNQDVSRRCDRIVVMGRDNDAAVVKDIGTFGELVARGHKLQTPSIELKNEGIEVAHTDRERHVSQESTNLNNLSVIGGQHEHSVRVQSSADTSITDCESQYIMEKCPEFIPNWPSHPDNRDSEIEAGQNEDGSGDSGREINSSGVMKTLSSADDSMATGAVPLKTYLTYLRSVGNPLIVVLMLAGFLMANGAQFFQQYTVAKWTEAGTNSGGYLESLTGAAVVVSVFLWIRSFLITRVGVLASRFWHKRMLKSVFSAPMAFFRYNTFWSTAVSVRERNRNG